MTESRINLAFTAGDVVVVTGAGSGIGRAVALRASEVGLSVAAWDRDAHSTAATVAEIERAGGSAVGVIADVSISEQIDAGFDQSRRFGVLRYLVNNAGPASADPLGFDEALQISVGSARRMVDTWLQPGAPEGAALVNIASVAGNLMGTSSAWYSAAKAALAGYTRHLAAYRSDEVRSNVVAPGLTDTPRLRGFIASDRGERLLRQIPLHRLGHPDDVAWTVLFLLSPLASYINGAFVPVDGGWSIAQ